jgi:hypothetical protein
MLPAVGRTGRGRIQRVSGSGPSVPLLQLGQDAGGQGEQAEIATGAAAEAPVQHAVAGRTVKGLDPVVGQGSEALAPGPVQRVRFLRWADTLRSPCWGWRGQRRSLRGRCRRGREGCSGSGLCTVGGHTGGVAALAGPKSTCRVHVRRDSNPEGSVSTASRGLRGLEGKNYPIRTVIKSPITLIAQKQGKFMLPESNFG